MQQLSQRIPFFQIDAFAEKPFQGNPAAVCLLDAPLADDRWALAVAREMNLSETAFVEPADASGRRPLRWFTPELEVDLCGHATLAAAHALWQSGDEKPSQSIVFRTRSGDLRATRAPGCAANEELAGSGSIQLDFPARPAKRCAPPGDLLNALGMAPRAVGLSAERDYLVEVDSADFVRDLRPDLALLATVEGRGFIVTALVRPQDVVSLDGQGQKPDFVSRFFAPACGIAEDPVTGSAHCTLGPYWAQRLKKATLLAYQASARGGFVGVTVADDRVVLTGGAVTVVEGELLAR